MKGEAFPRSFRLIRRRDFQRVFDRRLSVADGMLVVFGARNELDFCRLGIAVSKKVGNAVHRNRWKRLVREAFRRQRSKWPGGIDLIVMPRRGGEPSCDAVSAALQKLVRELVKKLDKRTSR